MGSSANGGGRAALLGGARVAATWLAAVALAVSMVPMTAWAGAGEGASGEPGNSGAAGGASHWSEGAAVASAGSLIAEVRDAVRVQSIDALAEAYQPGEIIVTYRDGALEAGAPEMLGSIPDAEVELISGDRGDISADRVSASAPGVSEGAPELSVALVELPEELSVGQAVVAAESDPGVAHAQPNYRYYALEDRLVANMVAAQRPIETSSISVNDEYAQNPENNKAVPNQWWLSSVRAQDAWEYARCDNQVTVAVLDTGINFEHEDLAANILSAYAWDATADGAGEQLTESPSTSELSHGSHVAGIAAARANNEVGIAGSSYNANILPICVFTASSGRAVCDDADLVKAYNYLLGDSGDGQTVAQATNTRVINMSLGGYGSSGASDEALHAAIVRAEEAGILTVAAGGNGDGYGNPRTDESYPSDFDEVMSVVALESDNQRVSWSDYNSHKDIAAPGVNIWSTWWTGDEYECESGTSMASPLVAGCAALLWAYDPALSVAQVKDALYSTAVDLGSAGKDDYYGWGRIDAAAALESLGTAHITAERTSMGRTGTQTLVATDVSDPTLVHTWKWSVMSGADVVAVGEDSGVVSALKAGSAVVHVEAVDSPEVFGNISLTVTEITIPGGITVDSDGVNHRMVVKWKAADAAVEYRVLRSTEKAGTFAQVGEVAAQAGAKTYSYSDANVKVATDYFYRVVPVGQLGEDYFEGKLTESARGFFTDKAALSDAIDRASALVADAIVSSDGKDVAQSSKWVTQADLGNLSAALVNARRVFASGNVKQMTVDTAARNLASAMAAYASALKSGAKPVALLKGDVTVAAATFTGKALKPKVSVKHAGKTLVEKTHYTLKWADNVNAGSGKVTVTGTGLYKGSVTVPFTINKAANPLTVKAKSPSVRQSKKKDQSVAAKSALAVSGAKGTVTYERVAKGSSKWLAVNSKTGAVTVKKGAPKKTLAVNVKVKAAGNGNYKSGSKTVTVKVKVK